MDHRQTMLHGRFGSRSKKTDLALAVAATAALSLWILHNPSLAIRLGTKLQADEGQPLQQKVNPLVGVWRIDPRDEPPLQPAQQRLALAVEQTVLLHFHFTSQGDFAAAQRFTTGYAATLAPADYQAKFQSSHPEILGSRLLGFETAQYSPLSGDIIQPVVLQVHGSPAGDTYILRHQPGGWRIRRLVPTEAIFGGTFESYPAHFTPLTANEGRTEQVP